MRNKILVGVCVALILSTAAEAQMRPSNVSPAPAQRELQQSSEAIIDRNTESLDANKKAGNAAAVGDPVVRGASDPAAIAKQVEEVSLVGMPVETAQLVEETEEFVEVTNIVLDWFGRVLTVEYLWQHLPKPVTCHTFVYSDMALSTLMYCY